jgi:uncharacterized OB-fold protein
VKRVRVSSCRACGWRGFPERIWCPRCGSDEIEAVAVEGGVVEEATVLRRAPGRDLAAPVRLGTVLVDGGGRLVARLVDADAGTAVKLESDDGAPVGRG